MASMSHLTIALTRLSGGERRAADELLPEVYQELRHLARSYLATQRADHTLQPTALVHEAFLKLIDVDSIEWQDRAHFFAVAAKAMREILVDHARGHNAAKRGGDRERVSLGGVDDFREQFDVLAVEEALQGLEKWNERAARIVELRLFADMTAEEIATVLGVSRPTVVRDLAAARIWMLRELDRQGEGD